MPRSANSVETLNLPLVRRGERSTGGVRPGRSPTGAAAGGGPTLIASVQRALHLLEAVGGFLQGATAKQLARAAGLPLGTTYHLLRTLTHEGYLRRSEGRFFYGASVSSIGEAGQRQHGRSELRAGLDRLSEQVDAAVYFAAYRDGEVELLAVAADQRRPAVAEWADFRATAHAHAIGQCLLSQLTEQQRRDHLARHRPTDLTPATVTEEAVLLRRWAGAQPTMPVFEHQEYALGTVCAAVPITVGATVATVALSLPVDRSDRLAAAAGRLRGRAAGLLGALSASFTM
ncbi:IclR family transcriptional regulator [Kitasatospora sp. NPDC058965]|uniref:IclR family transcriptional regulator n=1 Tax=Kitasatospora sp. NPDC058965 TaxID=3346682 RepID=UPI003699FAEB